MGSPGLAAGTRMAMAMGFQSSPGGAAQQQQRADSIESPVQPLPGGGLPPVVQDALVQQHHHQRHSQSDDDSGCALEEYTWVPPGLRPDQVGSTTLPLNSFLFKGIAAAYCLYIRFHLPTELLR